VALPFCELLSDMSRRPWIVFERKVHDDQTADRLAASSRQPNYNLRAEGVSD
jgi:hypothetical protein